MLRRLLALGITMVAAWAATASASAVAEPTLTLREYCPVVDGQQRYGFEAMATGLQPLAIVFWSWSYRPLPGETGGDTSDAWQATIDGVAGPFRLSFDRPMRHLDIGLVQTYPLGASLHERIRRPCKHANNDS